MIILIQFKLTPKFPEELEAELEKWFVIFILVKKVYLKQKKNKKMFKT